MRLAITGHRPEKLGADLEAYVEAIRSAYADLKPEYIYEGQAPGADIIAACAASWEGIPYEAVVPWSGHRESIPSRWRSDYDLAILGAHRVEVLSDAVDYPGPWVFHNRNKFMVDHADSVLALWDGWYAGGTGSTVEYALKNWKVVYVINPYTLERSVAS